MITLTTFRWVPPFAQGLVRDLRVRWALEEAGIPYEEKLIGVKDQTSPEYRALQPFGQSPPSKMATSSYSNPEPSCWRSPSAAMHCCPPTRKAAHVRARGHWRR
ncbi:glutathione S-transferase N-terminal domain-containing protein [Bordetella genomosp. 4]|uniref:glutathione S-transferase N-terminal domain-containing protein n=1 Tax=Bordetella genomosp. 4 TaxID=463044 RepID=UPI0020CD268A|nr:glutathione S-transferase N-terminal domain-containing protein [Bordetella genomosp. 4]